MNMLEGRMSRSVDLIVDLDHFDVMWEGKRMVLMVANEVVVEHVYEDFVLVVCDGLIEGVLVDIFSVLRIDDDDDAAVAALFEVEFRISVFVIEEEVVLVVLSRC